VLRRVAVCCSVLRCDAVCVWCEVKDKEVALREEALAGNLVCVAACCSVLQRVAACCSVLQRVVDCCGVLLCAAGCVVGPRVRMRRFYASVLQGAVVCCRVL